MSRTDCGDNHFTSPVSKSHYGITARGYTHDTVNHTIQFVDPATGVNTNMQEGLWYHVKKKMTGCKNLDDVLVDFMFRRRFNATSGIEQIANTFNGYVTVLRAD